MTKQEALEILDWIPTKGDEVDAMEMAIEALKKQDDEPVGCYGCVHERHGNQVCDACSRSCLDRYVRGDSDDE